MKVLRHPAKILLFVLAVVITQLASSCDNDAFNSESGVSNSVIIESFNVDGDGLATEQREKISLATGTFTLQTNVTTTYSDVRVDFYVSALPLTDMDDPTTFFETNATRFHGEWCGSSDRASCALQQDFSCRFYILIDPALDPDERRYLGCGVSTDTDVDVTEQIGDLLPVSGYIITEVCNVVCKQSQQAVLFTVTP